MGALANWMARWTWAMCLWLMRRPWMRKLQARSFALFPASRRSRILQQHLAQNRFARRVGLPALKFMYTLLLASMLITACYFLALALVESRIVNSRQ